MTILHGTFQLPDCKPVLVTHHDSQLLAGAGWLPFSGGMGVTIYSAVYSSYSGPQLCQLEVIFEVIEPCICRIWVTDAIEPRYRGVVFASEVYLQGRCTHHHWSQCPGRQDFRNG